MTSHFQIGDPIYMSGYQGVVLDVRPNTRAPRYDVILYAEPVRRLTKIAEAKIRPGVGR